MGSPRFMLGLELHVPSRATASRTESADTGCGSPV